MTYTRLQYLKLIYEIALNNEFHIAPVSSIIKVAVEKFNVSEQAVRKMLCDLKKSGLVESPVRGCYRLTERGKKFCVCV